jgi:hypothetical protein
VRKLEIVEVDSGCYIIKTTDFQESDSVEYHWDITSQSFYGEYQRATIDKRQFQREVFPFRDYPKLGDAVDFILKRDRELMNDHYRRLVTPT